MTDQRYSPPQAPVRDVAPSGSQTPVFHAVSIRKLVLMSICTLDMYLLYWHYRKWQLIRDREHSDIWPAARAIFAIFFCYPLFSRIRDRHDGLANWSLPASLVAAAWIIAGLLWRLPPPYFLISLLQGPLLIPVQLAANAVNQAEAAGHDPNARIKGLNWLALALGGPLVVLAVIGSFLPDA